MDVGGVTISSRENMSSSNLLAISRGMAVGAAFVRVRQPPP